MAKTRGRMIAGLTLAAVIGVFAGAAGFTFDYAEGASYLSNDPKACVNCHVMREHYDGWQKGPHHAFATCNDCHVPHDTVGKYTAKAIHGWRHSKAFTLQDFHEPIRITPGDLEIVHENCLRCHTNLVSELPGHAGVGGMGGDALNCTHCHVGVGHGSVR